MTPLVCTLWEETKAVPKRVVLANVPWGNPNEGLANGGLAQESPIYLIRPFQGNFCCLLRLWGAEESVPISPQKARIALEKAPTIRRVKSTPDPDTFGKYRDTPPICIAILLQKYALFLAERSIYTTNLYHDTAPICIAILLQKY